MIHAAVGSQGTDVPPERVKSHTVLMAGVFVGGIKVRRRLGLPPCVFPLSSRRRHCISHLLSLSSRLSQCPCLRWIKVLARANIATSDSSAGVTLTLQIRSEHESISELVMGCVG